MPCHEWNCGIIRACGHMAPSVVRSCPEYGMLAGPRAGAAWRSGRVPGGALRNWPAGPQRRPVWDPMFPVRGPAHAQDGRTSGREEEERGSGGQPWAQACQYAPLIGAARGFGPLVMMPAAVAGALPSGPVCRLMQQRLGIIDTHFQALILASDRPPPRTAVGILSTRYSAQPQHVPSINTALYCPFSRS